MTVDPKKLPVRETNAEYFKRIDREAQDAQDFVTAARPDNQLLLQLADQRADPNLSA